MNKRKQNNRNMFIVLGGLGVAIFGGIIYSKQNQPLVGTYDELTAIYEQRQKAAIEERMKAERPTGDKGSLSASLKTAVDNTPRVTVAQPLGPDGKAIPKEWRSILVLNKPYRAKQAIVNDSAPSNQWYNKDARQPGHQGVSEEEGQE